MSVGFWVMNDKKIDERTFEFALKIVQAYKFLVGRKEFVLSKQLLRAGTSIGANVQEAQAAQSRKDFASKMAIASKEARETLYWVRLLAESGFFKGYKSLDDMHMEIRAIINIITKIVKTTTDKNPKLKTQN